MSRSRFAILTFVCLALGVGMALGTSSAASFTRSGMTAEVRARRKASALRSIKKVNQHLERGDLEGAARLLGGTRATGLRARFKKAKATRSFFRRAYGGDYRTWSSADYGRSARALRILGKGGQTSARVMARSASAHSMMRSSERSATLTEAMAARYVDRSAIARHYVRAFVGLADGDRAAGLALIAEAVGQGFLLTDALDNLGVNPRRVLGERIPTVRDVDLRDEFVARFLRLPSGDREARLRMMADAARQGILLHNALSTRRASGSWARPGFPEWSPQRSRIVRQPRRTLFAGTFGGRRPSNGAR